MNANQLAQFDDERGELDLASPEGPDTASGPTGFAGELTGASGSGRAINTTAVVLGIIVAAAAVGILSMRWVGSVTAKPSVPGDSSDLVAQLPEILKGMQRGEDNPLTAFGGDPNEQQVPVDLVQKNPFFIPDVDTPTAAEVVEPVAVRSAEDLRRDRRMMIENAANRIAVSSLLTGSMPVAIVDNRAVRLGDIVVVEEFEFTVESIETTGVTVVYEDPLLRSPVRVTRGIENDQDRGNSGRRRPARPRR